MMTTRINTGKFKIPLKLRKPLPKLQNFKPIGGELSSQINNTDIEELNDTLEMINDNYDTFKTIFTAPNEINVNKEIKQETAGMILKLFNPKIQIDKDPIRLRIENPQLGVPEYNYKPWTKDLASFISAGFDEIEYNKNKGEWKDKNINDFKKLFD